MNVLSLFDGKSSGYTACELAGIEITNYYSSEVDKYAIQVSDAIHPNQVRLGDVTKWQEWDIDWSSIDMIFGGFPCQAWSVAGKQMGDKDERGMLFWAMLDIMKHVRKHNPKADFLIENVKMKDEFERYITHNMAEAVGDVHKIMIDSSLVSAQNRKRYYWTSFEVKRPEDKGIVLKDVVTDFDEITKRVLAKPIGTSTYRNTWKNMCKLSGKSKCLTASGQNISNASSTNIDTEDGRYYKLTPRECFRLQTTPEYYIDKILACGVSNTQLYKIAGNGWTDEVIAHILKCLIK